MISKPMNVKREVHIEIDEASQFGFKAYNLFLVFNFFFFQGLPFEWEKALIANGIQKNEIIANLTNIADLMTVYENGFEFSELPTKNDVSQR